MSNLSNSLKSSIHEAKQQLAIAEWAIESLQLEANRVQDAIDIAEAKATVQKYDNIQALAKEALAKYTTI